MADSQEKRGPVEKGEKGWPVNPIGVVALLVITLVIIFLIAKPLFERNSASSDQNQNANAKGGQIQSPQAGEIVRTNSLNITLSVDEPQKAQKVQFWVRTYADGKWNLIGESQKAPFNFEWQIPPEYKNKSIALTTHILQADGNIIKDPGGWKEGIIILSE